jgi:hypothetical protein
MAFSAKNAQGTDGPRDAPSHWPGKVPLSFYLEKDQLKTLSGAPRDVASGIRDADSFGVGSP